MEFYGTSKDTFDFTERSNGDKLPAPIDPIGFNTPKVTYQVYLYDE